MTTSLDETIDASDAASLGDISHDETLAGAASATGEDATLDGTLAAAPGRRAAAGRPAVLPPASSIGRYVVLNTLGAGAMGVVYAAYDPELERKVAIKLVLPGRGLERGQDRLLREAQALAKLSHPNVVTVYDVGVVDGQVWLAMEFIDGQPLSRWLAAARRSWRAVVEVMTMVGRGVAAAHAAGLLHRDLKPDNVMIGNDGRVRVMDFGLARGHADADDPASTSGADAWGGSWGGSGLRLTQAGALLGTPAYMAPELLAGADASPASDQFGYCASFWEALYGQRAFTGDTLMVLMTNVSEGRLRPPPSEPRVPRWLHELLLRGLANDPAKRFTSMAELLDVLERAEQRARRRRGGGLALALGLLVAAAWGHQRWDLAQRREACVAAGARIDAVWSEDARARLHGKLAGVAVGGEATLADKVLPWVDAQAQGWREASTTVCTAATVDMTWTPAQRDQADFCLEQRRLELAIFIGELTAEPDESDEADVTALQRAVQTAAGFEAIAPCIDERVLIAMPELPEPSARAELSELRESLARAAYLEDAGKYDEGLAVLEPMRAQVQQLDWPPLSAALRLREAMLLEHRGDYAEAEVAATDAYMLGSRSGAWDIAAEAGAQLIYIVGHKLTRRPEARVWARHAEVAIALAGDPLGLREADRLRSLGIVERDAGALDDARSTLERVVELQRAALGPDHPELAKSIANLAHVDFDAGRYDQALPLYERALAISEAALGPEHPGVGGDLHNLGNCHRLMGRHDSARQLFERALAIYSERLGPEHPEVATTLNTIASLHLAAGEYAQAQQHYRHALSIREHVYGPDHASVAMVLANLAIIDQIGGAYEQAAASYARALAIFEQVHGPEHAQTVTVRFNLALLELELGDYASAREQLEQVRASWVASLGPDHPDVGLVSCSLGRVELASGSHAQALARVEAALAIYELHSGQQEGELEARYLLAWLLNRAQLEPERAAAQLDAALAGWAELGNDVTRAELDAWLAKVDAGAGAAP